MKKFVWLAALMTMLGVVPVFADAGSPADLQSMRTMLDGMQKQMTELQQTIEKQNLRIQQLESKAVLETPLKLPKENERLPVTAGMGNVKLGLLIQEWYTVDEHAPDNFRNRRLEIGFSGKLTDHLKWTAMMDPSLVREDNSTRSLLKDAVVSYDGILNHEVKLGQYKIPLTEEGFRLSSQLDTIERSYISRTFSDKRDIGLMIIGKPCRFAEYQAGVFNGTEANNFDTNNQKDLIGRFVLKPFPDNAGLRGLEIGSSGYYRPATGAVKKRIGLEARYSYGPWSLKSEYLHAQDGRVPADGWYVQGGYFFLPRWQALLKYEGFNLDQRGSEGREYDTTVGLNYFIVFPTTKFQLNYVHKEAQFAAANDNQVIGAVQYAF